MTTTTRTTTMTEARSQVNPMLPARPTPKLNDRATTSKPKLLQPQTAKAKPPDVPSEEGNITSAKRKTYASRTNDVQHKTKRRTNHFLPLKPKIPSFTPKLQESANHPQKTNDAPDTQPAQPTASQAQTQYENENHSEP